jgi:hypothetical protein
MPNGAPLIPYAGERFADRRQEMEAVCSSVAQLARESPSTRLRVMRFFGMVGSGKSWLLRRSQEEIGQRFPEIPAWRLCLVQHPETADTILKGTYVRQPRVGKNQEEADDGEVRLILQWLIEQAVRSRDAEPVLVEKLFDLQALWERLDRDLTETAKPYVLLVDGLDEVPVTVFRLLEDYCLVPAVNRGDVLVILGMRIPYPRPHVWPQELKSGADDWLEPFGPRDIQEQLSKAQNWLPVQAAGKSDEIWRLGGGYPLSNVLLAAELDPDVGDWLKRAEALENAASHILSSVDPVLRDWFWALCVLQEFDVVRLQTLFEACGILSACWSTYIEANKALMRLTETRLVVFDNESRHSYTMDRALRCGLHNALLERDEPRWRQLHGAAVELYGRWIKDYPRASDRWLAEAAYHEKCLKTGEALLSG